MDREEFLRIYYYAVEHGWFERDGTNGDESRIHMGKGCFATLEIGDNIRELITSEQSMGYNDEEIFSELMNDEMTFEEYAVENFEPGIVIGYCPRKWASYSVDFENSDYEFIEHGDDTCSGTEYYLVQYALDGNKIVHLC